MTGPGVQTGTPGDGRGVFVSRARKTTTSLTPNPCARRVRIPPRTSHAPDASTRRRWIRGTGGRVGAGSGRNGNGRSSTLQVLLSGSGLCRGDTIYVGKTCVCGDHRVFVAPTHIPPTVHLHSRVSVSPVRSPPEIFGGSKRGETYLPTYLSIYIKIRPPSPYVTDWKDRGPAGITIVTRISRSHTVYVCVGTCVSTPVDALSLRVEWGWSLSAHGVPCRGNWTSP